VGVYHSGWAAQTLIDTLNRTPDMNAFILLRMDASRVHCQ